MWESQWKAKIARIPIPIATSTIVLSFDECAAADTNDCVPSATHVRRADRTDLTGALVTPQHVSASQLEASAFSTPIAHEHDA
jgi:hypothetical protein